MLRSTRQLLEHRITSMQCHDEDLAKRFRTLADTLLNARSLTDTEKLATAALLIDIVEKFTRTCEHCRSDPAMTFLVEGFTRIAAHISDVAPLWANIEPTIRRADADERHRVTSNTVAVLLRDVSEAL